MNSSFPLNWNTDITRDNAPLHGLIEALGVYVAFFLNHLLRYTSGGD